MLILPQTTTAAYGYLLREGVVLNLPDEVADRLIQSGYALAYTEPAPAPASEAGSPTAPTPVKRAKKEA